MEPNTDRRIMSDNDLANLGLQFVAYVKPVAMPGVTAYAIYAADGTEIGIMENRDIAMAAVRSHDLEPVCVH
jgi:hypothetical protein